MSNTLLPCPFCGGEAKTSDTTTDEENKFKFGWIGCQECRVFINYINNQRGKLEASAAWNRRANLDSCENVRCENCKHYNRMGCSDGFGWCERMDRGTNDDFYCSLAERKEE